MYNLGGQFVFNMERAKGNPGAILQGNNYRFTCLSERLIRLEYDESGIFNDSPTQNVFFRNFEKPETVTVEDNARVLKISSPYYTLEYLKGAPFSSGKLKPAQNLRVRQSGTDRIWYYGNPEAKNLGGLVKDLESDKSVYEKSLFSWDGFATIDDSKTMLFLADGELTARENTSAIDIYLFVYGKDFDKALQDYFMITGSPSLIPRFALGNWWSRGLAYSDKQVRETVEHFEQIGIPLSVFLFDYYWHNIDELEKYRHTGYTWNKDLFSNPAATINFLHDKGIRVGVNTNPINGFGSKELMFQSLTQYIEAGEDGRVSFAPLSSKSIDTYLKVLVHPLDNIGIDFWWVDYPNKNPLELFSLNHYQSYDMKRNYQRRPIILSRNAQFAQHRYPILYSGKTVVSWDNLKRAVLTNLNAANSGVSWWSHDIGGFYGGTEDGELYTRYIQLGAFSPILRMDSDQGDYYKREPWKWNIKIQSIAKKYFQLRNRLIPYIYAAAYEYTKNGVPVVGPMYHRYPEIYDDEYTRYQYYFGSQLLVAPILTKEDYVMDRVVHKIFIPNGVWYDFVTGKKFPGKRKYITFFKDDEYPVYARAGAIIPLSMNDSVMNTVPPKDMEIHIFPGRSNMFRLYEDDGVSSLYKKGFFITTEIEYTYSSNNYALSIRPIEGKAGIIPDKRNYRIRFRNTRQPDFVEAYVNGVPVDAIGKIDETDFVVDIVNVSTTSQLIVNCRGKNIEIDAIRVVNEEIKQIISDLAIETAMKEKIDSILFSAKSIQTKRVEIRLLERKNLDKKFVRLFLRMLEYIGQI